MASTIKVVITALDMGWTIQSYLIPNSISESKAASFDQQQVRGRSVPLYGYSHSETRSVELSLLLVAGGPDYRTGREVYEAVQKLKSAVYPRYQGLIFPPTRVRVTVGKFLEVPIGVITNVSVTWGDTFDVDDYAMKAEVSLSIEEVEDVPSGAHDIAG